MAVDKSCIYHVWGNVQLTPGNPKLATVCLACGMLKSSLTEETDHES